MEEKLRVWWIPQVPMKSFTVPVPSVEEGVKVMEILALYDLFQYENKIKPDYSNAGGLSMLCEDEVTGSGEVWVDWYDEETGIDDPAEYLQHKKSTTE